MRGSKSRVRFVNRTTWFEVAGRSPLSLSARFFLLKSYKDMYEYIQSDGLWFAIGRDLHSIVMCFGKWINLTRLK